MLWLEEKEWAATKKYILSRNGTERTGGQNQKFRGPTKKIRRREEDSEARIALRVKSNHSFLSGREKQKQGASRYRRKVVGPHYDAQKIIKDRKNRK